MDRKKLLELFEIKATTAQRNKKLLAHTRLKAVVAFLQGGIDYSTIKNLVETRSQNPRAHHWRALKRWVDNMRSTAKHPDRDFCLMPDTPTPGLRTTSTPPNPTTPDTMSPDTSSSPPTPETPNTYLPDTPPPPVKGEYELWYDQWIKTAKAGENVSIAWGKHLADIWQREEEAKRKKHLEDHHDPHGMRAKGYSRHLRSGNLQFPGGWVHKDSEVDENVIVDYSAIIHGGCKLLHGVIIGKDTELRNTVAEKYVEVGRHCDLNGGRDMIRLQGKVSMHHTRIRGKTRIMNTRMWGVTIDAEEVQIGRLAVSKPLENETRCWLKKNKGHQLHLKNVQISDEVYIAATGEIHGASFEDKVEVIGRDMLIFGGSYKGEAEVLGTGVTIMLPCNREVRGTIKTPGVEYMFGHKFSHTGADGVTRGYTALNSIPEGVLIDMDGVEGDPFVFGMNGVKYIIEKRTMEFAHFARFYLKDPMKREMFFIRPEVA